MAAPTSAGAREAGGGQGQTGPGAAAHPPSPPTLCQEPAPWPGRAGPRGQEPLGQAGHFLGNGPARLVPEAGRAASLEEGPCSAPWLPLSLPHACSGLVASSGERDQPPRDKTGPCTPVRACRASHLLGPLGETEAQAPADVTEGLRAPVPGVARRRGPGDTAHRGGSCQRQAWSRLRFAPAHPAHPLRSPQECAPPPAPSHPFPVLPAQSGNRAELTQEPGGSLRGRRPGAVPGPCLPQGRHTCRPRCHASAQGGTGNARPAPAPELAMDPEPQGAALVGVRQAGAHGRPATPSPFLPFGAPALCQAPAT